MAERRVLGFIPCINCGARVELKLNTRSFAHYACNGWIDPDNKNCGIVVGRFGGPDTAAYVKHFDGEENDQSNAGIETVIDATGEEEAPVTEGASADDDIRGDQAGDGGADLGDDEPIGEFVGRVFFGSPSKNLS